MRFALLNQTLPLHSSPRAKRSCTDPHARLTFAKNRAILLPIISAKPRVVALPIVDNVAERPEEHNFYSCRAGDMIINGHRTASLGPSRVHCRGAILTHYLSTKATHIFVDVMQGRAYSGALHDTDETVLSRPHHVTETNSQGVAKKGRVLVEVKQ
jgi:hypothetical protein